MFNKIVFKITGLNIHPLYIQPTFLKPTLSFKNFSTKDKINRYLKKRNSKKDIKLEQSYKLMKKDKINPVLKDDLKNELKLLEDDNNLFKNDLVNITDSNEYFKKIETSFESFFHKREISISNFNYFLQCLVRQGKIKEAFDYLNKMPEYHLKPTSQSFNQVLLGYSKNKDIAGAEMVFNLAKKKNMHLNKFIYNSLLLVYAKNQKVVEAESIINEMVDSGLEPDNICYTTLIHAYNKAKNIEKCWEIYNKASIIKVPDEFLISYMIRLCAKTHNAEKAVSLSEQLNLVGFDKSSYIYNSLIYAYASRWDYAPKAIETFIMMKDNMIKPDIYTYVGVLRATAKLGDVTTANNVIKEMKILNLEFTEHIYVGLLSTYAGACRIDYVKNEHIEKYVQDSWEIFKLYCKTNKPNINILNSLLEVLSESHEIDQIDGKLLPLYNKNNISMNVKSYELLMKVFWDKRQGDLVLNLYAKLKNKGLVPNIRILNTLIECSIKRKDANGILEALQTARSIKREINHKYLVMLGKLKEVPDRLYFELKNWPTYGELNKKIRSFKKPTFSNRRIKKAGYLKSKGRRYRKS